MITVIGLGPGPYDLLTIRAARTLESAKSLVLLTAHHPTVASFPASLRWTSLDAIEQSGKPTESITDSVVDTLLELSTHEDIVFAVPGDPVLENESVRQLIERAANAGQEVEIIPGPGLVSELLTGARIASSGHLQIMDGQGPIELNPLVPTVVRGVRNQEIAASVKQALLRLYPPTHPVTVLRSGSSSIGIETVLLMDIDNEPELKIWTSLYVPALEAEDAVSSPFGLRAIVHRLRAPGGCPWDREQTPSSLVQYVLEEAHEVADAIEEQDPAAIREELGDLLLQVYLQAEIAEEQGDFDVTDVVQSISEKLIRRHPHVFAGLNVRDAQEVERNWERLKQDEKGNAVQQLLDGVPRSMPALSRAQEVQRKMAKRSFDWAERDEALEKLDEELAELREAIGDRNAFANELGDVLFMLAKLATDAGVDAEAELRGTIRRVANRFEYSRRRANELGTSLKDLTPDEQLKLWEEAKQAENER